MVLSFFPPGETWLEDWCSSTSTLPDLASKCILVEQGHHQRHNVCSIPLPPCFFNSKLPLSITNSTKNCDDNNALTYGNNAITDNDHQREDNVRQRREKEEVLYDTLEETKPIDIEDGCVTFCCHFKYLGSYISFGLTDDYDIEQRLTLATQSMGALKSLRDSPHLEIWSKYLLFHAIPMNLLLWGCKTWSMWKSLLDKLEVFFHRSIRRILQVSMTRVKEECTHNEHVWRMFYDIPRTRNMTVAHQMDFIGNVVRAPHNRQAQYMLSVCCDNTRLVGHPFLHNKDHIVKNL